MLVRWLEANGQMSAAETVLRDWDDFVTFYDFPAEHWIHLRTSNPIESLFAGVRLRTDVAKRMRRRENALYLVFKIAQRLEHSWRPLNGGLTVMTLLLGGARFIDGVYVPELGGVRCPNQVEWVEENLRWCIGPETIRRPAVTPPLPRASAVASGRARRSRLCPT